MNFAALADLVTQLGAFGVAAIVIWAIVSGRLVTKGHHVEVVDALQKDIEDCRHELDMERARHEHEQ